MYNIYYCKRVIISPKKEHFSHNKAQRAYLGKIRFGYQVMLSEANRLRHSAKLKWLFVYKIFKRTNRFYCLLFTLSSKPISSAV